MYLEEFKTILSQDWCKNSQFLQYQVFCCFKRTGQEMLQNDSKP